MVASDRPTATLDSHESCKQILWTSARGNTARNPQISTNTADNQGCHRRDSAAGESVVRERLRKAQAAPTHAPKFTTVTAQSAAHQRKGAGQVPKSVNVWRWERFKGSDIR
jgi:hypothetical protein